MSFLSSLAKIGEVIAIWRDPSKREVIVLRGAIEAATELLLIERKQGIYEKMAEPKRNKMRVHYQKQFDSWRDGK